MANVNRHLRGDQDIIIADVRGNVTVEVGDFMVRNGQNGMIGYSTNDTSLIAADNYAFPFSYVRSSTAATELDNSVSENFLGVAMEASTSGNTEKISIATAGVYRYPLDSLESNVTLGSLVSAVSPTSVSGISTQAVINHATASGVGSSMYLGRCVKTESGASYIDFDLHTTFNKGFLT
jgi:hypothetical protein